VDAKGATHNLLLAICKKFLILSEPDLQRCFNPAVRDMGEIKVPLEALPGEDELT
jgi:hypothetical protein